MKVLTAMKNRKTYCHENKITLPYTDILMELHDNKAAPLLDDSENFHFVFLLINMFCDMSDHANIWSESNFGTRRFVLNYLLSDMNLTGKATNFINLKYFCDQEQYSTFSMHLDALINLARDGALPTSREILQGIINIFYLIICTRHIQLMEKETLKDITNIEKREIVSFDALNLDAYPMHRWQMETFSFSSKKPLSADPAHELAIKLKTLLTMPPLPIVGETIESIAFPRFYNELKTEHLTVLLTDAIKHEHKDYILSRLLERINPIEIYKTVMLSSEDDNAQGSLLNHLEKPKHNNVHICICLLTIMGYLINRYEEDDVVFNEKLSDFVMLCKTLMPLVARSSSTENDGHMENNNFTSRLSDSINLAIRQPSQNKKALNGKNYKAARQLLVDLPRDVDANIGTMMFFKIVTKTSEKKIKNQLTNAHRNLLKCLPKANWI